MENYISPLNEKFIDRLFDLNCDFQHNLDCIKDYFGIDVREKYKVESNLNSEKDLCDKINNECNDMICSSLAFNSLYKNSPYEFNYFMDIMNKYSYNNLKLMFTLKKNDYTNKITLHDSYKKYRKEYKEENDDFDLNKKMLENNISTFKKIIKEKNREFF
ncbi:hypothetical protein JYG23_08810 [Sedimentibacter sp. zth1]|uniref:hypothetical protein n=1 Tax=Sedimentibacter sp. zth1 TaxID=2816908 RepID=UPI001A92F17A|nr:hypothetical protein [Sedimentibacter sp. zth1]QSX04806.1 hypothetical protein JYG23_08810 [Sedimentibacter sp. zth1]